MTHDERLCRGIEKLGLRIEPGLDTSAEGEYVVYAYSRNGALWGDDAPCLEQRFWTVVYVAPTSCDRLEMRIRIMQTILSLFEVWPHEDDATDETGQRWVYEFSTIGGLDDGADGSE